MDDLETRRAEDSDLGQFAWEVQWRSSIRTQKADAPDFPQLLDLLHLSTSRGQLPGVAMSRQLSEIFRDPTGRCAFRFSDSVGILSAAPKIFPVAGVVSLYPFQVQCTIVLALY